MQAISNSKQNFTGNALKLGEFSHITSNNVDKALPKLRKMISKKPFDLIIQEDRFSGNVIKISAEKVEDHNANNLKHVTAYATNRAEIRQNFILKRQNRLFMITQNSI